MFVNPVKRDDYFFPYFVMIQEIHSLLHILLSTMDFIDQIKTIASRAEAQSDHLGTEEATKNALIMPFINTLGYNVF